MATIEVEKLIHQLEPKYLQDLRNFLEYLLFVQNKQARTNGKAEKLPVSKTETAAVEAEEEIPERLQILKKYAGAARYPDFPTSKYDVYDQ